MSYEGYGPGGVAIIVECSTDNKNRTAADVRYAFTHHGGSIGTPGCVGWMFKKKGIIIVDKEVADEDTLMLLALDSGAEDVQAHEEVYEIITEPDAFIAVSEALEKEGIEVESSEVSMIPDNTVSLDGEKAESMQKMIEALEEIDDVQEVYHNADMQ